MFRRPDVTGVRDADVANVGRGRNRNVERDSFLRAAKDHSIRKGTVEDFRAFEKAWKLLEQYLDQESRNSELLVGGQLRTPVGARGVNG